MTIHVSFFPDEDRLILQSELVDQSGIELIPGSRFRGSGVNRWHIPRTHTALLSLVRTFGADHIKADQDVIDWWTAEDTRITSIHNLIEHGLDTETAAQIQQLLPDQFEARPHQLNGAVYLGSAKGGALFDEPGMGKTATVGMAMSLYGTYPALVVAPKSLLHNWKRELARFGIESTILIGTPAKRRKFFEQLDIEETPVLITSYEMVKAHSRHAGYGNIALKRCTACGGKNPELDVAKCEAHKRELNAIDWSCVILDEAHRIKDRKTAQTRACWAVAEGPGTEYRWPMTGTPIESSPMDLWSLLRFMSPDEWSGSSKFMDRYVNTHQNYWGGTDILGLQPDTLDEFRRVTGWRWVRNEHTGLPERITELRTTAMKPKEAKAYKQMKEQLMAELPDGEVLSAENNMIAWLRLCQFASATVNVGDDDNVYLSEPSSKLDLMEDTLLDINEPVILWFVNVDLLKMAEERLKRADKTFVSVYGNMDSEAVDHAVQSFQNGEVDHILLTVSKGSEGITLTRSRVSINVQRHPSSIKADQAEKRNERIGSEHHPNLLEINLVTEGTVEEEYDAKMAGKHERRDEVLTR